MTEILQKLVITPEGEKYIPLSAEEIAQRELEIAEAETRRAAFEAETARIEALKVSAREKMVAGEPLTEEEAAVVIP